MPVVLVIDPGVARTIDDWSSAGFMLGLVVYDHKAGAILELKIG